jgi:uncharacterized protein YjbI with pentapeptide repeats
MGRGSFRPRDSFIGSWYRDYWGLLAAPLEVAMNEENPADLQKQPGFAVPEAPSKIVQAEAEQEQKPESTKVVSSPSLPNDLVDSKSPGKLLEPEPVSPSDPAVPSPASLLEPGRPKQLPRFRDPLPGSSSAGLAYGAATGNAGGQGNAANKSDSQPKSGRAKMRNLILFSLALFVVAFVGMSVNIAIPMMMDTFFPAKWIADFRAARASANTDWKGANAGMLNAMAEGKKEQAPLRQQLSVEIDYGRVLLGRDDFTGAETVFQRVGSAVNSAAPDRQALALVLQGECEHFMFMRGEKAKPDLTAEESGLHLAQTSALNRNREAYAYLMLGNLNGDLGNADAANTDFDKAQSIWANDPARVRQVEHGRWLARTQRSIKELSVMTQASGAQTSGAQTSGAQTSGAQTSGAQTSGAQTSGAQTSGAQTSGAQPSDAQPSDAQPSSAQVIPIKRGEAESVGAKATKLLSSKKFVELEKLFVDARLHRKRRNSGAEIIDTLYDAVADVPDSAPQNIWMQRLELLKEWCTASPNSPTPHIALADFYNSYAWQARGGDWANSVKQDQWVEFARRLNSAAGQLEEALKVGPLTPEWFSAAQTNFLGGGERAERHLYDKLIAAGVANFPDYMPIYLNKNYYLQPRWFGASDEWVKYATTEANKRGGIEGDKFYARMVSYVKDLYKNVYEEFPGLSQDRVNRGNGALAKESPGRAVD